MTLRDGRISEIRGFPSRTEATAEAGLLQPGQGPMHVEAVVPILNVSADWSSFFIGCRDVALVDNGLGINNGEQGEAVSVCSGLRAPWTVLWPALRTIS